MKNISLITVNKPGLAAAIDTALDLVGISKDYKVKIYGKTDKLYDALGDYIKFNDIDEIINDVWNTSDAIIWFTATGIVIRKIAPLLNSKITDPAILVINTKRTQVIPLLSGHLGGANELSLQLADINPNLTPFITTASDCLNTFAFDNFTKKMGYEIVNIGHLAKVSNSLINGESINVITYPQIQEILTNEGLDESKVIFYNCNEDHEVKNSDYPTVLVSPVIKSHDNALKIKVKPISIGIGLNKNTPFEELDSDFAAFLKENSIDLKDIEAISSYKAKIDDEALALLARKYDKDLVFCNDDEINKLNNDLSESKAEEFFGIKGVAEPSAILSAPQKTLFVKKKVYKNTTMAAAF